MKDVYEEFSKKIVDKYKISKFKSKVRPCILFFDALKS